jgi:hypothetical protein
MIVRVLVFLPVLLSGVNPGGSPHPHAPKLSLVRDAAQLAAGSPVSALHYLHQSGVRGTLGADGKTIELRVDSREIAIVPAQTRPVSVPRLSAPAAHLSGRDAAVLEPFATELGLGQQAGSAEATALRGAGYDVTTLRDSQVTVESMATLTHDSVVYMETHAGLLNGGDAVIGTGQTSVSGLTSLINDGSVIQIVVAGDPKGTLYVGITGRFFARHASRFPDSSLLFLNGCSGLSAPALWAALQGQNLSTLVSWDHDAIDTAVDQSARYFMNRLASGDSVAQALRSTQGAGLGISIAGGDEARLGLLGNGELTIASRPTPVPTATSTPAPPTPASTPVKTTTRPSKHRCSSKRRKHGACRKRKAHRRR